MLRRLLCLLYLVSLTGCGSTAARRGDTVMYASGADLQSINPLFTVHPLARQVQRYVLLTTLVRYDSLMRVEPFVARRWQWSADGRRLTFTLTNELRWHDGIATTARDAGWTLERARDPATGYPRQSELTVLTDVRALNDSTLQLDFSAPPGGIPDVLTDLALLPAHLLDSVPPARLRQARWQEHPIGNGPFRFVSHDPNRRWVFERNPEFPASLGGPPLLQRLVIAVVDEPMTKLAALTSGELDVAGIQPAHAEFVRRDPRLTVMDYPLLLTMGIVFNTRRAPFATLGSRARVGAALDRAALVAGFAYGFGTPATGPVPPGVGGWDTLDRGSAVAVGTTPASPAAETAAPLRFELLTVGSGEAALEQMVQAQLAHAGITATIRQLELSAFLDRVYGRSHDFEAALLGAPGDLGLGYLRPLGALSGLTPPSDRLALFRFFRDSLPATFLYHSRGLQGINRRVHGVQFGLRGELATVSQWSVTP
jgi:peptide/nickel transport system substrate-binding protein